MEILMCNVAWMKHYRGISEKDYPINGGKYIADNGYGHEVINYEKNGQFVYGYVQARNTTINIDRIGGVGRDYVDNVLVVWRARSTAGSVVIGWYKNARVYRKLQEGNEKREFYFDGDAYYPGYLIRAKHKDTFLIPVQHRDFPVPVTHKGFGSQTFVTFLDQNIEEVNKFKRLLTNYIARAERNDFGSPIKGHRGVIDTETKARIEKVAVDMVVDFYINRGYDVNSVERENVGYDLFASKADKSLYIEVKGTSVSTQTDANVILTPNEYKVSKKSKAKYRICIVTDALGSPELFEFAWDRDRMCWFSEQSLSRLDLVESIAANLRVRSD